MEAVLWIVVAVLALVVAGVIALAVSSKREYRRGNQIVAGQDSGAPPEWAGAHTPEARLHRRLRDAVRGLADHPRAEAPGFADLRSSVEEQAVAVDTRLIAIAAMPERLRAEPLAEVTGAVDAVEELAARFAAESAPDAPALQQARDDLAERMRFLTEARLELDQIDAVRMHPVESPRDDVAEDEGTR